MESASSWNEVGLRITYEFKFSCVSLLNVARPWKLMASSKRPKRYCTWYWNHTSEVEDTVFLRNYHFHLLPCAWSYHKDLIRLLRSRVEKCLPLHPFLAMSPNQFAAAGSGIKACRCRGQWRVFGFSLTYLLLTWHLCQVKDLECPETVQQSSSKARWFVWKRYTYHVLQFYDSTVQANGAPEESQHSEQYWEEICQMQFMLSNPALNLKHVVFQQEMRRLKTLSLDDCHGDDDKARLKTCMNLNYQ